MLQKPKLVAVSQCVLLLNTQANTCSCHKANRYSCVAALEKCLETSIGYRTPQSGCWLGWAVGTISIQSWPIYTGYQFASRHNSMCISRLPLPIWFRNNIPEIVSTLLQTFPSTTVTFRGTASGAAHLLRLSGWQSMRELSQSGLPSSGTLFTRLVCPLLLPSYTVGE